MLGGGARLHTPVGAVGVEARAALPPAVRSGRGRASAHTVAVGAACVAHHQQLSGVLACNACNAGHLG